MTPLLCALFFLSGVAALLFETLWFRQAGLAFGNGVWASSLVLSSFMAGLALGNGLAARFGARLTSPLRAYALMEVAIAGAGVLLVLGLPRLTPVLVPILQPLLDAPALQNLVRLGAGFVLLLIPATAMGATLPLMLTALRSRDASFGGALGLLYGWNTLGAVLGAILGELVLLERLGVHGTAAAAAGCNALAAAGALPLALRLPRRQAPARDAGARPGGAALRVLAATFCAGAVLLALEVVWFRFLHLFVHSGYAAFAWMLAVVLAGIGLGGLLAGAWLRRRPDAWRAAPAVALASGVLSVVLYAVFHQTSALAAGLDHASPLTAAWLATVLALPIALLSGVLFPLLGASLARKLSDETAAAGWLTLANTVGSALGSLAGGFVLLPVVGLEASLFGLAAAYGGVAWLACPPLREAGSARWRAAAAVVFAAGLLLFPFGRMHAMYLSSPVSRWNQGKEHAVLALREGRTETAIVVERRHAGEGLNKVLLTDSFSMSGTATLARRYMKLFVYWPVAARPEPRSALLISYGVGSTAKALVDTRSLETIDVVDVSREILDLASVVYPDPEENPLNDPRVRIHVEDGRYFLSMTPRRFDLITGEPPPPKNAGIVNLYTREYFSLIHERLNEGGVTSYWLPVHNLLESDALAIVRAFCDVFDDCALWVGQGWDWMLTGSRGGIARPARSAFEQQWRDPEVARELRALVLERPAQLGATFLGDAAWLRGLAASVEPLTDAWPKRLSDEVQRNPYAAFGAWMDVTATAERFRTSDFVRALWPPQLREETLSYFEPQRLINRVGRMRQRTWADLFDVLHELLTERSLPELALWQLGFTADWVDAAESAQREGRPLGPHLQVLASRALVDGAFLQAARRFSEARASGAGDPGTALLLELYARCRAGDVEGARSLLAGEAALAATPRQRTGLAWLRRTFDLASPAAAGRDAESGPSAPGPASP